MRQGCPLTRHISGNRCQVGRYRSPYVFAQDHGRSHFKTDPSLGTHNQGNRHSSAGRLNHNGQQGTKEQKNQNGAVALLGKFGYKFKRFRIILKIGHGIFQVRKPHKQKSKTYNEFSNVFVIVFLGKQQRYNTDSNQGNREFRYVEIKSKDRNNPGCHGSTNIGSHNNAYGLHQTYQPRIDETNHHHRCGRRRLDNGRYQHSHQDSRVTVRSHSRKEFF